MRCSSCDRPIVAGGLRTNEGVFCGANCHAAYLKSRERMPERRRDGEPARPLFSLREAIFYGMLIGIAGNYALNDLALRQAQVEEPADVTEAMQAMKNRAMDQVRTYDSISDRLLSYFGDRSRVGHGLGNFSWSATRMGGSRYRVRLTFTEDRHYRLFSWQADLSERSVMAEDAPTASLGGAS